MKKIDVDILCPNRYIDGVGDSYEARVYFDNKVDSMAEALLWADYMMRAIKELDDCHGSYFELYIAHIYVGELNKFKDAPTLNGKKVYKAKCFVEGNMEEYNKCVERELEESERFYKEYQALLKKNEEAKQNAWSLDDF